MSLKMSPSNPGLRQRKPIAHETSSTRSAGSRRAMISKRTKNGPSLFQKVTGCAVLLWGLAAACAAQGADRYQVSFPSPQMGQQVDAGAQPGPQPPCGKTPNPPYPVLDHFALVKAWSRSDLGAGWKPPACTGWNETGYTTLVTIAARFPYTADSGALLRHVGAITGLAGVRYWSTTHKQWQTLVVDAHALTNAQGVQRRGDFTADEMKAGQTLYFEQVDNLTGRAIYRLHIVESSTTRIVFNIENVSTIRYWFLPIFHPGDLQSMYFLDRESDDVWRYYSITRTAKGAGGPLMGNESSAVNRAVAFYRYMVGIPSTQEPPAAR